MKLTAQEIAKLTGGTVDGDAGITVTCVAPLGDAGPADCSFLSGAKYRKELAQSKAGVVLMKKDEAKGPQTAVFVDNPQAAFAQILHLIAKEKEVVLREIHPSAVVSKDARIGANVGIGPCAVVEPGARIGDGVQIGAQCYVGRNAAVGDGCKLYPQVVLREEVALGKRVIVHSGAVIGADGFGYVTVDKTHHKIPQVGSVEIGDDVEIGANVTVDRATIGKTVIGKGSKIDNLVQIAHNVKIGEGCIIVSQAGVAGSSKLGNFVTLAGQVGVVGHINIGDGVIAAAQSGIPNDVPAGSIIFGSPARPINEERKIQAIISRLPEMYDQFRKIKKQVLTEDK